MRAFFKRQSGIVRTAEFALAVGAAVVALGAGGDMFVVAIAISFALFFAFVGFCASNLSSWLKVWRAAGAVAIVLLLEFGTLFLHFHGWKVLEAETTATSTPILSNNTNNEHREPLSLRQLTATLMA